MKKNIFIFLFSLLSFSVFATHNKAGDISYTWISGNTYQITVHTFTNVASPADRCELTIYFGDGDSAIAPRVNGVTSTCTAPDHDGVQIPNNLRYNIYQVLHTYPGDGTYNLSMTDPNRSAGLLNMTNSLNSPFILTAQIVINSLLVTNNSSPTWNHYLDLDTIYASQWHGFNASGNDPNGTDIMVYTHIPCIGSTGYVPPFTSTYFGINQNTGIVSWDTPSQIGYYAYSVKVEEFRYSGNQYYNIGYTTREIFNVVFAYSGINNLSENLIQTNVFPNPSNSDLTISINSKNKFENLKLEVLDISGREIEMKYELKDQTIIVRRKDLTAGLYFFRIFNNGNYLSNGKFEIVN